MTVPIVPGQPSVPPIPVVPPPPKRKLSQAPIGGIVVAACVLGMVAYFVVFGATWPPPKFGNASKDVTVESCGMSSARMAEANLKVHNTTSATHDYAIAIRFMSGDVQVGTATAIIRDLAAGGVALERAVTPVSAGPVTSCSVTTVGRS